MGRATLSLSTVRPHGPIPEREQWMWDNEEVIASIMRGIEQARCGEFSSGPGFRFGQKGAESNGLLDYLDG